MRARNEFERKVESLAAKLPSLSEKQIAWAKERCFFQKGFLCKGKVWCNVCGRTFSHTASPLGTQLTKERVVCPHCGHSLSLESSTRKKDVQILYFTVFTTCGGCQVIRHFCADRTIYRAATNLQGRSEPYYSIGEAVQIWISPEGKDAILARPCKPLMMVYDAWNFSKPMTFFRRKEGYYSQKYDVNSLFVCPGGSILPVIRRNGFTRRCTAVSPSSLMKTLLTDNEAEMLAKTKQYDLLALKVSRGHLPCIHAVNIANRNGYIVKDASMWVDYISLLDYFGLDTHNAHYVCPKNLKVEHDKLLKRKNRRVAAEKAERERQEAAQWEERYSVEKAKYFGICFGDKHLRVTAVRSVAEMADEGKYMHHCVFACGYYKRPDSLILSAKDMDGNRIETVEVNLSTFTIVQSRGVNNSSTPYHQEIIDLINRNMNQIKQLSI